MGYILLWLLFAVFSAMIASSKGRSRANWFLAGLLFGPFGLLVAFLENIKNKTQSNTSYIRDLKDTDVINEEEFLKRKAIIEEDDKNSTLIGYIVIVGILAIIYFVLVK